MLTNLCVCMHACVCDLKPVCWVGAHFDQSLLDEAYAPVALIKPQQNAPLLSVLLSANHSQIGYHSFMTPPV